MIHYTIRPLRKIFWLSLFCSMNYFNTNNLGRFLLLMLTIFIFLQNWKSPKPSLKSLCDKSLKKINPRCPNSSSDWIDRCGIWLFFYPFLKIIYWVHPGWFSRFSKFSFYNKIKNHWSDSSKVCVKCFWKRNMCDDQTLCLSDPIFVVFDSFSEDAVQS